MDDQWDYLDFPWALTCDDTNSSQYLDNLAAYTSARIDVGAAITEIQNRTVEINVPNQIHPKHDGVQFHPQAHDDIEVVIFGSSIGNGDPRDFDVTQINLNSLAFGPGKKGYDTAEPPVDLNSDGINDQKVFFENIWEPLQRNFEWYVKTQASELPGFFRWRGRTDGLISFR